MNRRRFLHLLEAAAVGTIGTHLASYTHTRELLADSKSKRLPQQANSGRPQVAITMDDPSVDIGPFMTWHEANRRLLDIFAQRRLKVALFVCGMRVDQPDGQKLLSDWEKEGHLIGNHSYSHLNFNGAKVTYERFVSDFARNEPILQPYSHRTNLFRYPGLKEGDTVEKRDGFRALLKSRGYRNGGVTIDTSDWYVDQRMRERLTKDSSAPREPYRDYLISHLLDRANFYRQLALDTLGHEIRHTILLHYRPIEALFLGDVMSAFEKGGWEWTNAEQAFDDPVFLREPQTLPAGESLVWALAAESGQFKDRLRYPGEDDVYEKPKMDALGL
jgi:peptidoglycan-N-acetylglucosamine deacetylase